MELRQLRYFVTAAEEEHFGRAAARLYVTGPTLSQQIAALERDLKVRLFDRDSRGVGLAPAGAALLPEARRILASAEQLRGTAVAHRRAARDRQLVVGLHSVGFGPLTGPVLAAFRAAHPRVDVLVLAVPFPELRTCLQRGRVDVLLTTSGSTDPDTDLFEPLYGDALFAALPVHSELVDAGPLRVHDVLDRPLPRSDSLPPDLVAPFELTDFRGGEPARRLAAPPPATSGDRLLQVAYTDGFVAVEGAVTTTWRGAVAFVPLSDAPAVPTGVAVRRAERDHPLLSSFRRTAAAVVADLLALLPSARPAA